MFNRKATENCIFTERKGIAKNMNHAVAIITARGGSKRIPGKNIKVFLGKPILAYSIQAALDSQLFETVMVSTDSDEIAEVARKYGAEVPFMRSEKTSDDFATTADVLLEVLSEYEKRGRTFEKMACIYPTAPFVTAEKLQVAAKYLENGMAEMILPVVPFSYPPQRAYVIRNEYLEVKWKENYSARSQDLEKFYHDAGQFYFYNVEAYKENNGQIMEGISPMVLDEMEVQDIDNETDWKLAEIKYKLMLEGK